MEMTELKCPYCGAEVTDYDIIDEDLTFSDLLICFCTATCPSCEKDFVFDEVFEFSCYKINKEELENDQTNRH